MKTVFLIACIAFASAPALVLAQTGTYYDPIYLQVQQDPFDSYVQQSQQQWQADSYNQSLRNIQNAINNQTQQQAQLQQQQLYQQAAARCPLNSQPYVSKISGKIGGCICNASYYMQDGVCVSVSTPQPTSPTKPVQIPVQVAPKTYAPASVSNPAIVPQQQNGGGGSGASTGLESCNRMVLGEMRYFGELTSNDCYQKWQSVVAAAVNTYVAVKNPTEKERTVFSGASVIATASTETATTTTQQPRKGFWAWLLGLFSF